MSVAVPVYVGSESAHWHLLGGLRPARTMCKGIFDVTRSVEKCQLQPPHPAVRLGSASQWGTTYSQNPKGCAGGKTENSETLKQKVLTRLLKCRRVSPCSMWGPVICSSNANLWILYPFVYSSDSI